MTPKPATTPHQYRVAFIGLGNMGWPMAVRLLDAGHQVVGADPDLTARSRFTVAGGKAVESPPNAVDSADVVLLMLPSSLVVESVLGDLSLLDALAPGTVVIDMSSSDPQSTRQLSSVLATRDIKMVDAPVSGGVKGATQGTLTIMTGGDPQVLEQVEPLLRLLGRSRRAGQVGAGHALKAINNLLSATHLLATAEALEAGSRFGLDREVMVELINISSGRSGSTDNKFPNFILPGNYDSGFGLRLMLKDMRIATKLAREVGVPGPLGEQAVQLWESAAEDMDPDADHTEISRWVQSGTEILTERTN